MEERYEKILRIIYEASQKSVDDNVLAVDIGRSGVENYQWLVDQGYITKASVCGKIYLSCCVIQKTIHYFSNKEQ